MSAEIASGDSRLGIATIPRALRDILAGAISAVLSIAYCLSYAALIFSGPLANWVSYGVPAAFLSAAVAAGMVAWRSSIPFAIAGPDSSTSAVMAALAAVTVTRLAADGRSDLLEPVLLVLALATAITGVILCALGFARAGRAIRFVPFPVIGGFLGATGWLMILGAVHVITGKTVAFGELAGFAAVPAAGMLAAAIAVAAALHFLVDRWNGAFVLPAIVIVAILAMHLVLAVSGTPLAAAQAGGWMFQPQPAAALVSPWQPAALLQFPWSDLPWLAGELVAVVFVTTVSLLLNTTGVEIATRRDADVERELVALGFASIVAAALGGFQSCLSLSRTTLNRSAGANGRLSGFTVAAISAAMLFINPGLLGMVPKFVLGGVLLFAGARLCERWLVRSARQLVLVEYLALVVIAAIIVTLGFIAGVLIGVVIGCAMFAFSVSRVSAIKFSFDGSEYRSSLDRGSSEIAVLAKHGGEIQGITLHSYLFFGSTNQLYEHVKVLLAECPQCRFLLFDFSLVTGIDSSATYSFAQCKETAATNGVKLVLVGLTPELERVFRAAKFVSPEVMVAASLDRAIELCEDAVIDVHLDAAADARSMRAWLAEALGSEDFADRLIAHCIRLEVAPGQVIARQGDAAGSMHFIAEGRVGVFVGLENGRSVRVRSLAPNTTIGEMGLIGRRPRSANVQAEVASVLYELRAEAFEEIKQTCPALSQALLSYVVGVMSERLSFANRTIGALRR